MKPTRVEQIGVLLSAFSRVCLMLLGLLALTAPFGNPSSLLNMTDTLTKGLPIGDSVLRPMTLLRGLIVLVAGLTIFRTLQHWLVETYLPKTELDIGARNSISTVARYVGITLSALWTLAAMGIGFEKVALLASALSVGIGFGLQAITQNFVSGLILLAERPVKLGDRVRIGDQVGDIRRISVRATEIQTDDKSTVIVPNSEFITKSVQNLTMDGALGRISIAFSVPLNTDIVKLREVLLGLYAEHEAVLSTPPLQCMWTPSTAAWSTSPASAMSPARAMSTARAATCCLACCSAAPNRKSRWYRPPISTWFETVLHLRPRRRQADGAGRLGKPLFSLIPEPSRNYDCCNCCRSCRQCFQTRSSNSSCMRSILDLVQLRALHRRQRRREHNVVAAAAPAAHGNIGR